MPKFPFTNYHELNLDWILKKVEALFTASEENVRTIQTYDSRLIGAEQTATSAATAATAAQQLADAASANANSALSVAGTANTKADSALTAANDASGAVSEVLTIAQQAEQTAGAAVATANDAAATAASLESLANTANQNATAALESSQTADQKAVTAQTTATTNARNISTLQTNVSTLQTNVSTLQTNVSGLTSDVETLTNTVNNKADVIIDNASGSIASFADGADDIQIRSLVVNIDPLQSGSGDPSPTNVRPITGHMGCSIVRTGKNILNDVDARNRTINNVNFVVNRVANGKFDNITVNGTANTVTSYYFTTNKIMYVGGCILSGCMEAGTSSTFRLMLYDVDTDTSYFDYGSGILIPESINGHVCRIVIQIRPDYTASNLIFKPMIRSASITDSSFEPYTATTIEVSWQPEAGTVYGGTLDAISGVLTVDRVIKNSGFVRGSIDSSGKLYSIGTLLNAKTTQTGSDIPSGVICNYGDVVTLQQARDLSPAKVFAYYGLTNVEVFAGGYVGNEAELDSILPSLQIIYPLATPIVYQLSQQQINTLLGSNNIYSDVGSIADVEYPADTKLYIDGKIAELQALVLEN